MQCFHSESSSVLQREQVKGMSRLPHQGQKTTWRPAGAVLWQLGQATAGDADCAEDAESSEDAGDSACGADWADFFRGFSLLIDALGSGFHDFPTARPSVRTVRPVPTVLTVPPSPTISAAAIEVICTVAAATSSSTPRSGLAWASSSAPLGRLGRHGLHIAALSRHQPEQYGLVVFHAFDAQRAAVGPVGQHRLPKRGHLHRAMDPFPARAELFHQALGKAG